MPVSTHVVFSFNRQVLVLDLALSTTACCMGLSSSLLGALEMQALRHCNHPHPPFFYFEKSCFHIPARHTGSMCLFWKPIHIFGKLSREQLSSQTRHLLPTHIISTQKWLFQIEPIFIGCPQSSVTRAACVLSSQLPLQGQGQQH